MSFDRIRLGQDEIFETIVKDMDGRVIEEWKCMKKDYPKVVRILLDKFGLSLEIKKSKEHKDLDWAIN